jgi:GTPase SAR1 family protein
MAPVNGKISRPKQTTDETKRISTANDKQKRVFKIIVVGDQGVGKTCLTYRFCERKFLDEPEATIGVDFRERTVDVSGEEIKVSRMWDTVFKLMAGHSSLCLTAHSTM